MSFFKGFLDNLLGFFTLRWFFESFSRDNRLEGFNVQGVSGWQQVVVVDNLDEWLNLGSLGNLLGTLSLGNLQWVSFNTGNQSVTEWVRLGTVIMWLDDNDLLTSVTTADNDSYFKELVLLDQMIWPVTPFLYQVTCITYGRQECLV